MHDVPKVAHKFAQGDQVRILSLGQKGVLLNRVNSKEWNAQIGIIKTKVKEADLEYMKPEQPKKNASRYYGEK